MAWWYWKVETLPVLIAKNRRLKLSFQLWQLIGLIGLSMSTKNKKLQATAQLFHHQESVGHWQRPMTHVTHPEMVTHLTHDPLTHFHLCRSENVPLVIVRPCFKITSPSLAMQSDRSNIGTKYDVRRNSRWRPCGGLHTLSAFWFTISFYFINPFLRQWVTFLPFLLDSAMCILQHFSDRRKTIYVLTHINISSTGDHELLGFFCGRAVIVFTHDSIARPSVCLSVRHTGGSVENSWT